MLSRLIFSNFKRNNGGDKLDSAWRRLITSGLSSGYATEMPPVKLAASGDSISDNLTSNKIGLISPTPSAVTVLQSSADSRYKVDISKLRFRYKSLIKSRRYNQALQSLLRMEAQKGIQMSATDHACKVKLLIKVGDLKAAEQHFNRLPNIASQKACCLHLLNGYVIERNIEKAETFMSKLVNLGLTLDSNLYNEMMKLYMATSQYEKVLLVIDQMTGNKMPKTVVSYNLWMDAAAKLSGVTEAETVYTKALGDNNVKVGWSTMATLANIYIKTGLVQKAVVALKTAEAKMSSSTSNKQLGYFFLMTQYASLKNKAEVLRLWEACKAVVGRRTCANYMRILSCLIKLGDLAQAEKVFMEWESKCHNYDIRVSNVLLGAYMRMGWVDKGESLHLRTLEKGGRPNYKTWEILMEGWLRSHNMVKAINAMKEGLSMLKDCNWRPSQSLLVAFAEYFEKQGNLEDSNNFIRDIYCMGLATLPIYKSLLRIHLSAKRPANEILEMMYKDKIEMDNEISTLVQDLVKQVNFTPG